MRLAALFEATVGRRLLVRIWAHGVLLFAGVLLMVMVAELAMSDLDIRHTMRSRPQVAAAVAERVLARGGDTSAVARVHADTGLELSIYGAAGELRATSIEPPLAPPTAAELRGLAPAAEGAAWASGRLVVGAFDGGRLAAVAVVGFGPGPSLPRHLVAMLIMALVLAFVFVAAPLTRSIARPLERLGALARELGAGNLAVRAGIDRRDEIGDLARSFNLMAGQIQHLRAAERQLLGDVSHELRTPLARMRVVLDLAADADRDRVRRYLAEITTDLAELEQLIDDIITASRLDSESPRWDEARPPLRRSRIELAELVDAALVRFRARWPERAVVCELADGPLVVDGDPALLRRVLDNLLDNARKYSADDTPIALRVVRAATGDRPAVRVEVVDRGIGIAPEDQPRVFSAFFRADRSRTRASGGVGLGLALARRIVEAHGGSIGVESQVDRGSSFWFALALAGPAVE